MAAGRYAAACDKLEESQRLDPGTGTLWHLAGCYEKTGRLATAWAKYLLVAQETRRRSEFSKMRAALAAAKRLEPRLRRLSVDVPVKHRLPGLKILRNDERVGPGAWGTALPVDKGEHVVTATAPGRRPWKKQLRIGAKPLTRLRVPLLSPLPEDLLRDDPDRWYHDWVGWTVVGASALAVAGGTWSLVHAQGLDDEAADFGLIEERLAKRERAENFRIAGWVMAPIGVVGAAVGIAMLASHDEEKKEADGLRVGVDVRNDQIMLGIHRAF